jgi:flagellar biosynthesis protein FliR
MNGLEYLIVAFLLVLSRIGGFMATFPMFRSGTIPPTIKTALAISLSALWLSNLIVSGPDAMPPAPEDHWLSYGVAVIRELIIGSLLGFLLGLLFLPAQLAGSYLGQEMGFNMAGVTDPTMETTSNVFGDFLTALSMLLFFAADAHQLAIGALYSSFASFPLGHPLPNFDAGVVTASFSNAHRWGMELAAPMGVALFLVTIISAMLMKISPQLNLLAVGIPLRLALGLGIGMLLFPQVAHLMTIIFMRQGELIMRLGI